ncbi:MAG: murein biosynthesis integral membrane protein MurJ [Nitrospira sp.]|nr:murein biosynthesis integral membrane protein MurJ [Nitrospira sp.]MDH5346650.1 murein biosynthesis integral membrane protein MurJ [Nitrospira sp.]MDH5497577.1 murein biosynthesis integral membrane protein MurJ [Nitrospira sp.]MDH5726636.1 murein biosynthesis integral membrane protein MurJ [Nitrospira sp.]
MSEPTVPTGVPSNLQDENKSVIKSAGIIGVATFSSRILGFARDMVLARLFGATPAADAFFIAFRIPSLLRELFAEGSMSSAFIPVYTEYRTTRSKVEAWELASAVFTTLLTIVTLVTMVGVLAAPWLVQLLAPGFQENPDKLALTTLLARVMFPYLLFISLAALAMGILNSVRAFAAPAFSPLFLNVFIIVGAVWLAPHLQEPIIGVAIGVVAGGAAQFAMQLPSLKLRGLLFGFRFEPSHPGLRRIGTLMVPTLLGLSVTQINLTVSTVLASFFAGGPTYLFYGMRLIQFPLGIFGVALTTAILPTLSSQAARGALDELRTTLGFGLRMILFIILPAMVGLILLRTPIVHLFFEHGTFTAQDTAETALAVLCYAVGLWAFGGVRIIVTAFYSLQDTRTPAISAAVALAANVLFSLVLMSFLGAAGLALATALAAMVNGGILVVVLNRRLGGIEWKSVIWSAGRVLVGCIPIVVACWWVADAQLWSHPAEWFEKSAMLAVAIAVSVGGYLGVHAVFRSEELDVVWGMVRRKLGRLAR